MGRAGAVRWSLVAVMAAMGALGAARLVCVRGADRYLDVAEVLMGVGAAVMLTAPPDPVPRSWWATAFGLDAAWLVAACVRHRSHLRRRAHVRSRRRSWQHYVYQVAANLTMVPMLLTPSPTAHWRHRGAGGSMAGMAMPQGQVGVASGGRMWAALVGVLVLYFLADASLIMVRLHRREEACSLVPQRGRLAAVLMAPALTVGRHAAMAVGMAVMLLPIL